MQDTQQQAKPPINWTTTLTILLTTLVAVIFVPYYGYFYGFSTASWVVFGCFMAFTGLSITAGYHRLWAHKTYEAHWILKAFFAFWGAAALEMSILNWSASHRRHHRHVDDNDLDPYSANRGFWFSHVGWLLRHYETNNEDYKNAQDLLRDPIVMWQHNHYKALAILTNIVPTFLIGWMVGDFWGVVILAGFLRIVLTHNFTWFINSLAHMWGRRPYTDENTARDNDLIAIPTWGEGYHNYHHIFQWDYRNGVRWWQYDPSKWLIYSCSLIGLTTNLKRVPDEKIEKAVVDMQFKRAAERLKEKADSADQLDSLEEQYQRFMSVLKEWIAFRAKWSHVSKQDIVSSWESSQLFDTYNQLKKAVSDQRVKWQLIHSQMA